MSKRRRSVVLVAGIAIAIVAIVIVRVRERNKETMWAMYADIHNVATSQAAYYNDYARFSANLTGRYRPTHGATVRIVSASDTSWAAVARHPRTSKTCSITYSEPRGATTDQVSAARVRATGRN